MAPDEPQQIPAAVVVESITGESVKTLLDQGKQIGDDAAALVVKVTEANELDKKRQRRRDVINGALLALIVVGIAVLALFAVLNLQKNTSNGEVLTRLDRNQAGIDELVGFVHELQADQSGSSGQSETVTLIMDLLCASSDPDRVEACAALTQTGG